MKEYVSIDTKQTKLSTRIVALIVSMVLIGISIVRRSIYGGLIGAMIIAAMLLTKKTYVCEEGLVLNSAYTTTKRVGGSLRTTKSMTADINGMTRFTLPAFHVLHWMWSRKCMA